MSLPPTSLQQRLKALDQRKATRNRIIDDLRSGKYDGIVNGSEFFRRKELEPPRQQHLLDEIPDLRVIRGEHGQTLFRSITIPRGEATDHKYSLPHPVTGATTHPIAAPVLHALSTEITADVQPLTTTDICFLDTETTGLMGGTGTVPFLVGLGNWEHDTATGGWHFRLEQYLIEDFCHEGDMLERLVTRLSRFRAVCTYNGKTFDLPLLRARGILHRIPPAHFRLKHIDLLHSSRRWWRRMLESVSLKTVEKQILGIDRGPDLDSALIPGVFFHFARTGRADRMPAVLDHNAQDIITLGALLSHLTLIENNPFGHGLLNHPEEFASAARRFAKSHDLDSAALAITRALEINNDRDREPELLARLAALHKRRRAWPQALEILHHLRTRPIAQSLPAWIETAKYEEHIRRDPAAALALVSQCRRQVELEADLASLRGLDPSKVLSSALNDLARRERRLLARTQRVHHSRKRRPPGTHS
ncbi:ribonuclease H-like domain-containing protein [Candidatus Sumerlaeota bacterium]|nr:ribonuclease H-like domain-containing protein [Candidatus Sumerlaeota bacterium]